MPDIVAKDVHTKELKVKDYIKVGNNIQWMYTEGSDLYDTSAGGMVLSAATLYLRSANTKINDLGGGVIVGGSSLNSNTQLQVDSTTKGLVIPRMSTAQRNTLSAAYYSQGMSGAVIFNTDTGKLEIMDKNGFVAVH